MAKYSLLMTPTPCRVSGCIISIMPTYSCAGELNYLLTYTVGSNNKTPTSGWMQDRSQNFCSVGGELTSSSPSSPPRPSRLSLPFPSPPPSPNPPIQLGSWGSAVSSPSGVRGARKRILTHLRPSECISWQHQQRGLYKVVHWLSIADKMYDLERLE